MVTIEFDFNEIAPSKLLKNNIKQRRIFMLRLFTVLTINCHSL
jgi:hypothetical protein